MINFFIYYLHQAVRVFSVYLFLYFIEQYLNDRQAFMYKINRIKNNAFIGVEISFKEIDKRFRLFFYPCEDVLLEESKPPPPSKQVVKYEDKYLEQLNFLSTEFTFTHDELEKYERLFENELNNAKKEEVDLIEELAICQQELSDIENMEFSDEDKKKTYDEYGDEILSFEDTLTEKKEMNIERINEIKERLICLNDLAINKDDIKQKVRDLIINERLDKLKNSFIIEKTPLGNVLMFYDNNRQTFVYYSDNSMPYRYLEVVSRKYVLTFKCRFLYVDMETELKNYEKKKEKEEKEQKKKEEEEVKEEAMKPKKNVFAKFKSYNKDAGSGKVNKAPPPKNSIPNKKRNVNNETEQILLKEKSNHYTCEGKFANFNILKKVDRKIVDKKYSMSFSDFKKNVINKK